MEVKEIVAKELFVWVRRNNVKEAEKRLQSNAVSSPRELIRYEVDLRSMLQTLFVDDERIPRLLAYEVSTLSSLHLAAMQGLDEHIILMLDNDAAIDAPVQSGSTALMLASFGGDLDTVKLLAEVYKANKFATDKYGWSCLHYCSVEGHLAVVQYFVRAGVDVALRDKDGTTAAFRAQVAGHAKIVDYLKNVTDKELLDINHVGNGSTESPEDMYAIVDRNKNISSDVTYDTSLIDKLTKEQVEESNYDWPENLTNQSASQPAAVYSTTLPNSNSNKGEGHPLRRTYVRSMIQQELNKLSKSADDDEGDEPDYESPLGIAESVSEDSKIGMNTLRGIMREELKNWRDETFKSGKYKPAASLKAGPSNVDPRASGIYEDFYDDLKDISKLPPAPAPPTNKTSANIVVAPALPPRNQSKAVSELEAMAEAQHKEDGVRLTGSHLEGAVLNESVRNLAAVLGDDWRRLAKHLPIESSPAKVESKVKSIEKAAPNNTEKQAAMALGEWRLFKGRQATFDNLIIALREAQLQEHIPSVERACQEFTA